MTKLLRGKWTDYSHVKVVVKGGDSWDVRSFSLIESSLSLVLMLMRADFTILTL